MARAADRDAAAHAIAALLGVSEDQAATVVDMPLGMTTEANAEALQAELLALQRRIGAIAGNLG